MTFGYDNLQNFYQTNFALMQFHKYSLSDIEGMLPFERKIYNTLLIAYLEEQRQKEKQ